MAISSGFYNSVNGDRTYDADQFGSLFDGIIAPGVFPNVGDKFRVRPTNNGMSVYVGAGKAWLNNRWVENSGDETVTLTGSHATLDRIDLVCIEVDRSKAVRGAKIKVVQGTPAVTPLIPNVGDSGDRQTFALAQIKVIKNSRQIVAENIINLVGSARTPYVRGPLETINLDSLQVSSRASSTPGSTRFEMRWLTLGVTPRPMSQTSRSVTRTRTSVSRLSRVESLGLSTTSPRSTRSSPTLDLSMGC